jgi:hypothetical protein
LDQARLDDLQRGDVLADWFLMVFFIGWAGWGVERKSNGKYLHGKKKLNSSS